MTRDEAHRRAIEAGARAQFNQKNSYFGAPNWDILPADMQERWLKIAETIVTAYLAAMVLPISKRGDNMGTACVSLIGDQWALSPLPAATHCFFLPKVTK